MNSAGLVYNIAILSDLSDVKQWQLLNNRQLTLNITKMNLNYTYINELYKNFGVAMKSKYAERMNKIYAFIFKYPGVATYEISKSLKYHWFSVDGYLRKLEKQGKVYYRNGGKVKRWFVKTD